MPHRTELYNEERSSYTWELMHAELWKGEGIIQRGISYEMGGSDRRWTRASPVISKKPRRVSGRCSGAGGGVGRKIRALQELVPNGEAMEVEGLFREAANYIVCLQVQVQVMQMMLGELSPEEDS
ncbi:hypothetical protein ZIOFF_058160 [Zingiber officinale]|uniref:Uncharacterized protein n=1 Tax=Zingiber officinale TaxID=94328 RepID=A0A8J5F4G3_ZINOF|nr:hypothetical protein ZIOFF_058160 [Zingiber officinale]